MENYDILEWVNFFEKSKGQFDLKKDAFETDSIVLYPGRFYVLEYMATTKDVFNTRPVIISLGVSQKDPESFLCLDLSILPKKIRMIFIKRFFEIYRKEILDNIDRVLDVEDVEKQTWMKSFTYDNICRAIPQIPLKNAIKKYKIKNTRKIYALPFNRVYKVVGDYCDENFYMNGNIKQIQADFLKKIR